MGELSFHRKRWLIALALMAGVVVVVAAPLRAAEGNAFAMTPLVSDQPGMAPNTDPNLVNAWGLTSSPTSPWWVSDNGTSESTLYRGSDGLPQPQPTPLVVNVQDDPTGTVFNSASAFTLPNGRPARFLFDTEDGQVLGWNGGTNAVQVVDLGDNAVYKGLAIATTLAGPRLYATDFHNGHVDVFDSSFGLVPNSGFDDPAIPSGFGPFGIQTIGDRIFVTYAKQDAHAHDDVAGQGLGFVDVYDTSGNLLEHVAQHGQLNSPWGLTIAPDSFGRFAGDLLVGNFGDGNINAYVENNGNFTHAGELRDASGKSLTIDGLWALQVGQGGSNGPPGTLFFTAGPDGESHGLFGQINPS